MTDELLLGPAEEYQAEPPKAALAMHIKPWMIMTVAILAIAGMATVSGFILLNSPTEGERSQVIEAWQTVGIAAFFYFLGSSAGARNAAANREQQP